MSWAYGIHMGVSDLLYTGGANELRLSQFRMGSLERRVLSIRTGEAAGQTPDTGPPHGSIRRRSPTTNVVVVVSLSMREARRSAMATAPSQRDAVHVVPMLAAAATRPSLRWTMGIM